MQMKINRDSMQIIPDNKIDDAYIEDTLGLKKEGDFIKLTRVAFFRLPSSLAYLEAKKCES